jgi:hypothetical protein
VNNKLGALKNKYLKWKDELWATGLGRDTTTGGINADPEYWETQDATQPDSDDNTECAVSSLNIAMCYHIFALVVPATILLTNTYQSVRCRKQVWLVQDVADHLAS